MRHICTSIVATLVLVGTSFAATINVPGDHATIQGAINASSNGDVIAIAAGTYYEANLNPNGKAITIQGTLNGDGTLATTIDAQQQQGSRVFRLDSGEGLDTVIKDLVITRGSDNGGGIYCDETHPTITGCTITGNTTLGLGGGIFCDSSNPIITGCTISGNTTNNDGGGIFCRDGSNPTITDCTISGNEGKWGGGIYCRNQSNPTISGSTITGNTANYDGGGIYCYQSSNPTITDCTISGNTAYEDGGGFYSDGGQPTFSDCAFVGNGAREAGALRLESNSNAVITNCVFNNNTATVHGGAIYALTSEATFFNCTFMDNSADSLGGAIIISGEDVYIDSCFFGNNEASSNGGALYINSNDTYVSNSIFCNNTPDDVNGNLASDEDNQYLDECPPAADEDGDGVADWEDNCYLYNPDQADCNENGVGDVCDVADFTSFDCDQNGVPDECQPDCDGDGWIDPCDSDGDCDGDGVPDLCEADCNTNGVPDGCEIDWGMAPDCNSNGIPDECDIADGSAADCNGNGVPDTCDIAVDPSLDCDGSGVLDTCELVYWYTMRAKPLASDGEAGDNFGYGIGIEGDVALVSARYDGDNGYLSGSVYVFERQLDGQWSETGKFSGDDTTEGDNFGIGVSVDGDLAAISAPFDDGQGGDRTGSVYIFERQADGSWSQVDKILAPEGTVDADFGTDVSLNGNRLLIGAARDNDLANNAGSAFIYERSESGDWIQQAKLLASDGDGWHYFGVGVALSEDLAMVGAPKYDGDTGVVYEFQRQEDGSWNELGKIWASDGTNGDVYGGAIAVENNRLFVNSSREQGFLYVYDRDSAGEWIEVDIMPGPDAGDNEGFGYDVALDGNQLLAGAHGDSNENGEGAGSFYIFQRTSELDCDDNGHVDSCELEDDPSLDCNGDGVLDNCQLIDDCNANGVLDECDIDGGGSNDANGNSIPDECEDDCNANDVPDHWDIKTGTSEDCNANGIPDECDTADGTSNDVNGNSIPDECEEDCNGNGSPDDWDLVTGWSEDCNGNLIPDECELAAGQSPAEGAVQWTVIEGGNGHWYQLILDPGIAWSEANNEAIAMGGHLVTLTSEEESDFVVGVVDNSGTSAPWIGLYQDLDDPDYAEPAGAWKWVTGEPFDYTQWAPDEPSNGGAGEHHGNIWLTDAGGSGGNRPLGTWNDWVDGLPNGYIIELAATDSHDCNTNGIPDECDIADETSEDINGDGVPDECQCLADIDGSGAITIDDLLAVIGYWGSSSPAGDLNFDGTVDIEDLLIIFDEWGPCP